MTRTAYALLGLSILLAFGCAHRSTTPVTPDVTGLPSAPKEVQSFHVNDPEPPQIVDKELEDIPEGMNPMVDQWVRYFQGKGRSHMERYLSRSTRYMTLMKRILRQNGLPEDLIYIALIESGFSSRATSRAAAVGFWQFIKGTGRRYGLEISSLVDERRDPVLATQAAAEYFKGLYSVFGSWYLAMASYNVGENRVKREVMRHYTRDFWELARKRRFPKETVNYVPKFIAAKMIAKNPEKYGFTGIEFEPPVEFEMIKVDKPLNMRMMASKLNLEYEDFKQLNPKFRGEVAPVKGNGLLELRVPVGQAAPALVAARESAVDKVELIADAGDTTTYRIHSGDSLYTIARRYRTTVSVLRDINDLKPGRKLRIGMRIQVPERASRKSKTTLVARQERPEKSARPDDNERATTNPEVVKNGATFYIVQPGDTLSAIADDYDSSISELRRMNRLSKGSVLKVGMRLRVPKDDGLPSAPDGSKSGETDNVAANESSDANAGSVSAGLAPSAAGSEASVRDQKPAATIASPSRDSDDNQHVVRAGENLTTIAKKYGVTIDALRKANNLKQRSLLRAGARLVIPQDHDRNNGAVEGGARRPATSAQRTRRIPLKPGASLAMKRKAAARVHIVRSGENLSEIAARYGVSLETITRHNNLKSRSKVFVGARLLIPVAEAAP